MGSERKEDPRDVDVSLRRIPAGDGILLTLFGIWNSTCRTEMFVALARNSRIWPGIDSRHSDCGLNRPTQIRLVSFCRLGKALARKRFV